MTKYIICISLFTSIARADFLEAQWNPVYRVMNPYSVGTMVYNENQKHQEARREPAAPKHTKTVGVKVDSPIYNLLDEDNKARAKELSNK